MTERKKLPCHIEDGEGFHVDVEAYDSKKPSYRNKFVYLAILSVVLILAYFQYQGSHSRPLPGAKPAGSTVLTKVSGSTEAKRAIPEDFAALAQKAKTASFTGSVSRRTTSKKVSKAVPKPAKTASATALTPPVVAINDTTKLQTQVYAQVSKVRRMRYEKHVVMEESAAAKHEIAILQDLTRKLITKQYGSGPIQVEMKIQFPESMAQAGLPQEQTVMIDLAPIALVPYTVFYFLMLVKHWKGGKFVRNTGHVLQASNDLSVKNHGMAFQEYHPDFPHNQYTMGFAGRPGGPWMYINTINNTRNHGPGSQGSKTEADGCFGRVEAQSIEVVKRMQTQPGGTQPMGFVKDAKHHIKIVSLKVVTTGK